MTKKGWMLYIMEGIGYGFGSGFGFGSATVVLESIKAGRMIDWAGERLHQHNTTVSAPLYITSIYNNKNLLFSYTSTKFTANLYYICLSIPLIYT